MEEGEEILDQRMKQFLFMLRSQVAFGRILQKKDAVICSESTVEDLEQAMNGLAEDVTGPGCVWREHVVGEDLLPLRLQGTLEGKRLRPG